MSPTVMVTTMFTDLVDSTAMASRLGPETAEEVRRSYFGLLRDALAGSGDEEAKGTGDGLHATSPSVSAALACATATQQAVDRHNRDGLEQLGVRIGVSHGEAELADDQDYYGASVVEAARLCAAAVGGQILTTEWVKALTGSRGGHWIHARPRRHVATPTWPRCRLTRTTDASQEPYLRR
jgi:class 3 adenylate cyclase